MPLEMNALFIVHDGVQGMMDQWEMTIILILQNFLKVTEIKFYGKFLHQEIVIPLKYRSKKNSRQSIFQRLQPLNGKPA